MPDKEATRPAHYLYVSAIVALLIAGLIVRSWGVLVDPLDLWADEAWWATLLETERLDAHGFRPIGYMWVCRQLLELGSPELMLRLPSWLAGCAALIFIYRSSELSFRSRTAVLFVLLLAVVHPKLVVFSKEFKPYSVEVFVFSALTFWGLVCLRRGRASAGFLIAAVAAIPFCYPVVFLYPGIALAFAGERLSRLRRFSVRQRVVGALAIASAFLALHVFVFQSSGAGLSRLLWGAKYDVFPLNTGIFGGASWYLQKTWELASLPGALDGMPRHAVPLFGAVYFGGAAALFAARRFRELALIGMPMIAVLLANLLGYWPYGAFRANLFLIPGALLVMGHCVEFFAMKRRARYAVYALLTGILIVAASSDPAWYRTKLSVHWAAAPQLTDVLDEIDRRRRESPGPGTDVVLADWHSWRAISYYLRDYPSLSKHVRLVRGPLADTSRLEFQIDHELERARKEVRATRLWIVVTRLQPHGAIRASKSVRALSVFQREFASPDREYHPVLFELRYTPQ